MTIPNLLIIAGTGNKSGKTTLACRLIDRFQTLKIISLKITPHFHNVTPGLVLLKESPGYSVFEETNPETSKDTSRMLRAGAARVFFVKTTDKMLFRAFSEIMGLIPPGHPVVCESPALRNYVEPGLFIIMISETQNKQKDISNLMRLPHLKLEMELLAGESEIPVGFKDGRWFSKSL